jgi:RNA polymerase sigma-70 factor, ECF subfamily
MSPRDEQELLQAVRKYDLQSLTEVYDRFSPGLYGYACRLLGDRHHAEDCVAETFARFLKSIRGGLGPREFIKAYLYRIAHNWITDFYRREPPPQLELDESYHADEFSLPDEHLDLLIAQQQVREAMRFLTIDQQMVIALRFFEDWENEDIAEALQKPVGTVKVIQHRALAALQKYLLPEGANPNHEYRRATQPKSA